MSMNAHVGNLSDLFYALFRAEPPLEPVIKGRPRMNREEYFALFFPEELCEQYLTKTKSNLTWFFNGDSKNKGIKHALMDASRLNCRQVVDEVHQKCKNVLWPRGQHPSFDREALYDVLRHVSIRPAINARLHLLETPSGDSPTPLLKVFYRADPSAALARILLTLSVLPDADEEMLSWIWDVRNQDISRSFLARESDVEGQIRYGKLLYLNGEHEQAYLVFERVAKKLNRNAETAEESDMYCRMAEMLLTGDGHYLDQELAVACLRKGLWEGNPESYHRLSQNLEGDEARAAGEGGRPGRQLGPPRAGQRVVRGQPTTPLQPKPGKRPPVFPAGAFDRGRGWGVLCVYAGPRLRNPPGRGFSDQQLPARPGKGQRGGR